MTTAISSAGDKAAPLQFWPHPAHRKDGADTVKGSERVAALGAALWCAGSLLLRDRFQSRKLPV